MYNFYNIYFNRNVYTDPTETQDALNERCFNRIPVNIFIRINLFI